MIRKTGSFVAVDDHGQRYTINIFTSFIPTPTLDDPFGEIEGIKRLETSTRGKFFDRMIQTHRSSHACGRA